MANKKVYSNRRISIKRENLKSVLQIRNASFADVGLYVCQAQGTKNRYARREAYVLVQGE